MAGQVALGVVALVRVGAAPLKPAGGQLVGGQGARAGGETERVIKTRRMPSPRSTKVSG